MFLTILSTNNILAGIGAAVAVRPGTYKFSELHVDFLNLVDAAIAYSLDHHIMVAYRFLMNYYKGGDRVYLIGFSRGAFTARVLAAMIERVGLLTAGQEEIIPSAWEIYRNWEYEGQPLSAASTNLADEVCYSLNFFLLKTNNSIVQIDFFENCREYTFYGIMGFC